MIRDRGNMKWTAMMLPEHVSQLREWTKEDGYESKRTLDEQQLEVLNDTLCDAMQDNREVVITYYEKRQYHLLVGKVHHFDQFNRKLHILDKFHQPYYIKLTDIFDARTSD